MGDPVQTELRETRTLAARAKRQLEVATDRCRHADDLRRRIAELDERAPAVARPAEVPDDLEPLAGACRAVARRRDELLGLLHQAKAEGAGADILRQLTEEVEPGFVDALAALADSCRPFDVIIDAARLEAAGVSAAGIDFVAADVLAEVAAGAAEGAQRAHLVEELERSEWDLPDVEHLADQERTLQRQAAALEEALHVGRRHPTVAAVEAVLVRRAAQTGGIGRDREPLPLVIDAALHPFEPDDKRSLLDAVARLAETTQIVFLTDDPDTLALLEEKDTKDRLVRTGPPVSISMHQLDA